MSLIVVKRVIDKKGLKKFIQFQYDLYRKCAYAVPFLYFDEMQTLSHSANASFECCDAEYFIAYKNGKIAGRIAGIINRRANKRWNQQRVRFGWFDFIDDQDVSSALIKAVEDWGRSKGMIEIAGPLGFTDMDREGMLVEGFNEMTTAYINYNYPYYAEHIQKMDGWNKDNDYLEYQVKVPDIVPEKFHKIAEMIKKRYNLEVHKFTRDELVHGGYGRKVFDMINVTYNNLYGYSELSDKQIDQLVDAYIKKANLDYVTSIIDNNKNGEMVGFGITFPSFARALQKTHNGRLFPFGWWHILRAMKWHHTDTVDLLLIGVLPEYRAKGANSLIFDDLIPQFNKDKLKWAEAMPQMEKNENVRNQWQYFEARQHRRHRVFVKQI